MQRVGTLFLCMLLIFSGGMTAQAINVDDVVDVSLVPGGATGLAGVLMPTATGVSATYTGSLFASGTFTNGTVDGLGFNAGVILTTGDLLGAIGPNIDTQFEVDNAEPGDPALDTILGGLSPASVSFNAAALSVDFTPPIDTNLMVVRFVFASEEYSEDIGSIFNDVFAVYVNGFNQAFLPGTVTPITTNTVFGPGAPAFNNNDPLQLTPPFGLQYDGFTNVMELRIQLTPNVPNTIRIALADGGDALVDSAVFLAPISFTTTPPASRIGVFRSGQWFLDTTGDGAWSGCGTTPSTDRCYNFGLGSDMPVAGDWSGSGTAKIGVFRNGSWYLDFTGEGVWDGCGTTPSTDRCYNFGLASDMPVAGDWSGSGTAKIGVFRNGSWLLDFTGEGALDGCGTTPSTDRCYNFGLGSDIPVVGDWSGSGTAKIGVFRNGGWYLDFTGEGVWDGCGTTPSTDRCINFGQAGDKPVVSDWNGDGTTKIGVFRNGNWFLDYNGNSLWDGCGAPGDITRDVCFSFGLATDIPISGSW